MASAGIDDLRIHDLRRTLGSCQAKTGASLAIIGKSLNHKNQNTTAIYARLDLDPVRDSVNAATSAMMAAAGVKTSADVVKIGGKTAINSDNDEPGKLLRGRSHVRFVFRAPMFMLVSG